MPCSPLGHGIMKKVQKNVKINAFRLKWSVHTEKGFAIRHFSIILFSLRVGVVHISYFLAHMQVFCCLEKFFITNNVRRELSYLHHLNLGLNNIREVEKLQYRYHNTFHKAACARVTQLSNLGHDIFKNVFAVVSQVVAEGTLHVFLPILMTV